MIYSSNTWGIAVATIINFLVGWVWFSALFGRTWAKLQGLDMNMPMDAKVKSQMMRSMVVNFITTALTAFIFFTLAENLLLEGSNVFRFALWAWLGFMMPISLGAVLWLKKPFKLFVIEGGQQLVALLVSALVYSYFL